MMFFKQRISHVCFNLWCAAALGFTVYSNSSAAQEDAPAPRWLSGIIDDDWLQLTSGEWLKGEITSLYNGSLSFDSDNLDDLEIDWEDVEFLRTHQPMTVLLNDGHSYSGEIVFKQGALYVDGTRLEGLQVVSIAEVNQNLLSAWSGEIGASTNIRHGNSEQRDLTLSFNLKRRSVRTRFLFDAMASEGKVDNELVEKNDRANASMDWFISTRWFLRPIQLTYYSDPFQNIETRVNYSAAIGYYLVDSDRVDWDVYIGPGYQLTEYETVQAGEDRLKETSVAALGTFFSMDVSDDVEFEARYRALLLPKEFGSSNHHLDLGLSIDLLSSLDLDIHYILDYIEDPIANDQGLVPERRDSELIVGVSLEF